MSDKQLDITFRIETAQAEALLDYLRQVPRAHIRSAFASVEKVRAFQEASEKLRVALVHALESDLGP
jgi:hypothetical protein